MGLARPFVGGGGTVALQHDPGAPAGDPHQVGLVAALGEPGMGEGVAEPMRVEVGDAGLLAAARAALGEAAFTGAWQKGKEMTLEQAVEYALQEN